MMAITADQADKATRLAPYEPHRAELLLLGVQNEFRSLKG
jgi:hypothetical protein